MLIEISGIDGSGKTTLADKLDRWLNEMGTPCVQRSLRSVARRMLDGIAAADGHASWRGIFDENGVEFATALEMVQSVHSQIAPINFSHQVILCDTYVMRWLGTATSNQCSLAQQLAVIYRSLPAPALSLRLDIPAKDAFERIRRRAKGDHVLRHGGEARLESYAKALVQVTPLVGYPVHALDATSDPETLCSRAKELIAIARDRPLHRYARPSTS